MKRTKIKLFENCFITRGATRSLLVDMQRKDYYLIPNSLSDCFDANNVFDTVKLAAEVGNSEVILEYIDFLISNELAFWCSDEQIGHFPVIDLQDWDYPAIISNATLETRLADFPQRFNILKELTHECLTRYLEIHITDPVSSVSLHAVLTELDTLDLYNYNVICAIGQEATEDSIVSVLRRHYKIARTIIYSHSEEKIIQTESGLGNIFFIDKPFTYSSCGIIDPMYFSLEMSHISESLGNNTCLNKKLAIDVDGNIKNCPNLNSVFGNVIHSSVKEVVGKPEFRKLWSIKKDDIDTCKDCEFRHICTDCRAFIAEPGNLYSKPLKCGYDPYTAIWSETSRNTPKAQATQVLNA